MCISLFLLLLLAAAAAAATAAPPQAALDSVHLDAATGAALPTPLPLTANATAWAASYASACSAHAPWREALSAYSAVHASALAALRSGSGRPQLSVYRIPARRAIIGMGCLLPGLSNVFLSALYRGRVFLLDWPSSRAALGVPAWLPEVRTPWQPLARALGANRTAAHHKVHSVGGETVATVRGRRAPTLWGPIPASDPVDLETHWAFNRGAYTQEFGAREPAELAWLARVIPRDASGAALWGCVYAAVAPLTPAALARSEAVPLPPVPSPPAPPHQPGQPPALVCLHVRTWALEPVPTAAPPQHSAFVAAAFQCLEQVLQETGARARGKRGSSSGNATVVYIASDDAEVRSLARARFGRAFDVRTAADAPAQTAYVDEADSDERADEVALSSWGEWARLTRCPVLITTGFSGYGRSAGAAGAGSALYYYDEDQMAQRGVGSGQACVRREAGAARELTKGFGAGW
jgi:hypothetical protein